jgi:hypothetical protein
VYQASIICGRISAWYIVSTSHGLTVLDTKFQDHEKWIPKETYVKGISEKNLYNVEEVTVFPIRIMDLER